MAGIIATKPTNQTELDQERKTCAAKLETYAAILKINQGFSAVVAGLEDLKRAGLLNEEWANSKERIDDAIQEVWRHQAKLNCSVLNPLNAVEENHAIHCLERRIERTNNPKTEERTVVRSPRNGAPHRGRSN